jgi:phosphoglycerate kinase
MDDGLVCFGLLEGEPEEGINGFAVRHGPSHSAYPLTLSGEILTLFLFVRLSISNGQAAPRRPTSPRIQGNAMPVTTEQMLSWCQRILGQDPGYPPLPLADYLQAIPRLDSLASVPSGTPVLVRGDVDAKPGQKIGEGDIRLRSMVETLTYGRERGWKQVIVGHIGRKPEGSLKKVAKRLGELLGIEVPLISDWLDPATLTVPDSVTANLASLAPGSVLVLENARKYDIERALWDAKPAELPKLAESLAKFANQVTDKIARVYVNEALSAGSLDSSTTVIPAAMDRVALGKYVAHEFDGPMRKCLDAKLVVFSGLKSDKLDDLEAVLDRGKVEMVFVAGSLAMALRKAEANLAGKPLCIGVADNPAHADKPYYIAPARIAQSEKMLKTAKSKGIEFVLPIDSVREDGAAVDELKPEDQQFDIGPKSSEWFAKKVGEFISKYAGKQAAPVAAFHNGVFGMFEDPKFEAGTRRWVQELKRLKDAGIEVYVGGGEGGEAINRYGQEDFVTHIFTAGGTILNALGSQPVPYLVALRMAAGRK